MVLGTFRTKTIILRRFFAKHLLEIAGGGATPRPEIGLRDFYLQVSDLSVGQISKQAFGYKTPRK